MPDPYATRYAAFNFGEPASDPLDPRVGFHSVYEFPGWENRALDWITRIIQIFGSAEILELGSGANPTLPAATVAAMGVRYAANDISEEELAKADSVFERWVWDLSSDPPPSKWRAVSISSSAAW